MVTELCSVQECLETRGPNGPDIAQLGILTKSIKVLQRMVQGINFQILMQSPGVQETSLVISNNILRVNSNQKVLVGWNVLGLTVL